MVPCIHACTDQREISRGSFHAKLHINRCIMSPLHVEKSEQSYKFLGSPSTCIRATDHWEIWPTGLNILPRQISSSPVQRVDLQVMSNHTFDYFHIQHFLAQVERAYVTTNLLSNAIKKPFLHPPRTICNRRCLFVCLSVCLSVCC